MDIGAWLAETYGQDLSGVTEIKEVPWYVTGSLDPLAKCTKLETLNLYCCTALTGTSSVVGPENDCSCI